MGNKAPPMPDYKGAAQTMGQQSQQNVAAQTAANRPNQSTGIANSNWVQGPNGQWTQQTSLADPLQGALGGIEQQLASSGGKFDNGQQAGDQARQAAWDQETSMLDPQWNRAGEQQAQVLANEGLDPNSEAFRNAMSQFDQSKNTAYGQARSQAIQEGNREQAQTFQQNMQQALAPFQELQSLHGLEQMPGFQGASQAQMAPLLQALGLQGNYGLEQAKMNNSLLSDILNGVGEIGGAFFGGPIGAALGGGLSHLLTGGGDSQQIPDISEPVPIG